MELVIAYLPRADLHLLLQAIGVTGFFFYVGGFAALQMGLLDGNGRTYTVTNILGASLVLISLISAFNIASFLIQVCWILFGLYGLWARNQLKVSKT